MFVGFSVNYMIRINVNISIVDMIDENFRKVTNNSLVESECIVATNGSFTTNEPLNVSMVEVKARFPSLERILLDALGVKTKKVSYRRSARDAHVSNNLSNKFLMSRD